MRPRPLQAIRLARTFYNKHAEYRNGKAVEALEIMKRGHGQVLTDDEAAFIIQCIQMADATNNGMPNDQLR